jgi:GH35 family endo-1,4-beta-xylanase
LLNPAKNVSMARRPDQKVRWDFPTVVEKYRNSLTAEDRMKWESLGF